jgi:tryptophan-rich sensory protein
MATGQLVFFAVWLALAMAAAVAIVFAWERRRARRSAVTRS